MNNFLKPLLILLIFIGGLVILQSLPANAQTCQREGDPCTLPSGAAGVCEMLLGDLACIEGQAPAPKPVDPCQGKTEGSSCTTTDGRSGACQLWIDGLVCVVGAAPTTEETTDPCQGRREGDSCTMRDGRQGRCETIIDALVCTVVIPNPCEGRREGDSCTLITGGTGVCRTDASGRLGCVAVQQPQQPTGCTASGQSCTTADGRQGQCVYEPQFQTYTCSAVQPREPGGETRPREPAGDTGISIKPPLKYETFQELVEGIARFLFQIGIPIAVIMILYAAFLYMTAGGSEEKVSKAHKALTYAVVGLAILFLAWGITSLVKELLGGETTTGQPQQQQQQDINPDSWQWQ